MNKSRNFIKYLENLKQKEDRGALAALRRGLGQSPAQAPSMHALMIPWLIQNDVNEWEERNYYMIASLYAYHPISTDIGNLGDHLRAMSNESNQASLDRRFTALLNVHQDDLHDYLRQIIGLLKSNKTPIPVNWEQLLLDVKKWSHPDRYVQRAWARGFWRKPPKQDNQNDSEEN